MACRISMEWPEFNEGMVYTDHVKGRSGCTLLQYYSSRHFQSASATEWRRKILDGRCKMNGVVCRDPDSPIPPNSVLEYYRPPWAEPDAPCYVEVLHQDAHLLAVYKPAGLQVLPAGPFHQRCVLSLLRHYYAQHPADFAGQPAPVHRLGRGTSGVLLCACTEAARRALSRQLEQHGNCTPLGAPRAGRKHRADVNSGSGGRGNSGGSGDGASWQHQSPDHADSVALGPDDSLAGTSGSACSSGCDGGAGYGGLPEPRGTRKLYRALVQGIIQADEGEVAVPIGKLEYPGVRGGLFAANLATGKPARSHFWVVRRDPEAGQTAVEVEIFTGRPHQIRIHMAAAGHPLVGDLLFGPGGIPKGALGSMAEQTAGETPPDNSGAMSSAAGRSGNLGEQARPTVAVPGDCGYLLHCMAMEFDHPVTKERLRVVSPPPPALARPAGFSIRAC